MNVVYTKCCRIWPQPAQYAHEGSCGVCGKKPRARALDYEVVRYLEGQLFELRRELYEIDRQITLSTIKLYGSY